ncbi:MAG: helix-turn-helix transcriptional regulator [Verrucomicrobia bacterium]|nr:helix-turn-helix transcriptional regulator [Verrucomicrobiota bacterium]
MNATRSLGDYLREWRKRRRWSQLEFALEAEISQRHLSFLESGRSVPSRPLLLRLAERLQVSLRERNAMLLAAGYAPVFSERSLDDPALRPARRAIDLILNGHEPYPALAVDRHWNLVAANAALAPLLSPLEDATLLDPPVNVLRLSLHPGGLARRIANFGPWRSHLLERLRRQVAVTGDPGLARLLRELAGYPAPACPPRDGDAPPRDGGGLFVPLELVTDDGLLSFFSTVTVFGTPTDITLSELVLESFFPADGTTADRLRAQAERRSKKAAPAGLPLPRG